MSSELNLGGLVDMLGVELRITQILADRLFSGAIHPRMAPGHFTILSLLKLNPGVSQSALARCMHLDRSSMVPILDQLQTRGWLERRAKSNDRRVNALHLTAKGTRALRDAEQQVTQLEQAISQNLGSAKRDALLKLVVELQNTLRTLAESDQ